MTIDSSHDITDNLTEVSDDKITEGMFSSSSPAITGKDLRDISYESLAESILSLAYIDKESLLTYKIISINFGMDFLIQANGTVHHRGEAYEDNVKIIQILVSRLESALQGDPSNLEFIKVDAVTKSVMVVTKALTDLIKDPNSEIKIGRLLSNYYKIWYRTKCLADPSKMRPEMVNKMFSKTELRFIDESLIPIFVMPDKMHVLKRVMDDAISVSPISDYILTSRGYNIYGKVEDVKMWWVPRVIAQSYLMENDILKVRGERVLKTLLVEANLLDDEETPKLGASRIPFDNIITKEAITSKTDEYIKANLLLFAKDTRDIKPSEDLPESAQHPISLNRSYELSLEERVNSIVASKTTVSENIDELDKIINIGDLPDMFRRK